jgi:hypothetical protein
VRRTAGSRGQPATQRTGHQRAQDRELSQS